MKITSNTCISVLVKGLLLFLVSDLSCGQFPLPAKVPIRDANLVTLEFHRFFKSV